MVLPPQTATLVCQIADGSATGLDAQTLMPSPLKRYERTWEAVGAKMLAAAEAAFEEGVRCSKTRFLENQSLLPDSTWCTPHIQRGGRGSRSH